MPTLDRRAARAALLAELQAGRPWREATAAVGLPLSRTSVYRLRKRADHDLDGALCDGRHGHPHKLLPPIHAFLCATCQSNPHIPSRHLQDQIATQFGVTIGIRHLNQVRANLRISYIPPKKTHH